MDLPTELEEKIFLELSITDLLQACSSSVNSRKVCGDSIFWKRKFAKDDLPLIYPRESVSGWILEYKVSKIAQLREEHYIEEINQGSFVQIPLLEINDVNILPDFLNKKLLRAIRVKEVYINNTNLKYGRKLPNFFSVLTPFTDKGLTFFLAKEDGEYIFQIKGFYTKILTEEQMRFLLYILCYYDIGLDYRVPKEVLLEEGIID
nr:hypothetical protein Cduv_472 [Cedratvirus duvanny]